MVADLIRDSTVGTIINYVSGGKIFPFPEERPDFVIPKQYLLDPSSAPTPPPERSAQLAEGGDVEAGSINEKGEAAAPADPYLVTWYSDTDPENPRNWSFRKRSFVAFTVSLLTFSVYIGSAIYTASIPGLMAKFDISYTIGILGLTLYVIGYGIGPMFLTPLQELPAWGRNPIYVATMVLFLAFQVPILYAKNMSTVLAMRFWTGFWGSPALATGGATMADVFPLHQLAVLLGVWSLGAICGPISGPIIGDWAAQFENWRWPMLELLWIAGFSTIFIAILLPETFEPTILRRRAQRLRKLTGNPHLHSATENADAKKSAGTLLYEALLQPFVMSFDPALAFTSIYLGFVYAVFYLWFESFPFVFNGVYHFKQGISGLPFTAFYVTAFLTFSSYTLYQIFIVGPRYGRAMAGGKPVLPEMRIEIGFIGSCFIPVSILWFGFTARESIHWIVPIIGAALYLPGIWLNFQSILVYVTSAYPMYAGSVLAANDFWRSVIAGVFPLFGHALFTNLGLGGGSGLLAGISVVLLIPFAMLWKWGHILRARSKYAAKE